MRNFFLALLLIPTLCWADNTAISYTYSPSYLINPTVDDYLDFISRAAKPSNPPTNHGYIYWRDDGTGVLRVYSLNPNGTEVDLTGGGGGVTVFTGLTDVPSSYTGQASKIVSVKSDETGLEFITNTGAVTSVFGRTGAITATNGDYTASQITNVASGSISSITVQSAINELDTEKIPLTYLDTDSGLTADSDSKIATQKATKTYVDTLVSSGARFVTAVHASTTTVLPNCTYNNGTLGVGATLTGDANGALAAQDGQTLVANETLLVKDQATASQNGAYTLTTVGDAGNPFVLTRITNYDQSAEMVAGTFFNVLSGTTNDNTQWAQTTTGTITVGTTSLAFAQLSKPVTITASLGVEKVVNDIRLNLLANGGLELTGNEVGVNTDDLSIEKDGTGNLQVKALGVTNNMLAGSIVDTKLNQITTASKVHGSSFTGLASIVAGAGIIPVDNLGSGTPSTSTYLRGDGAWSAIAGGASGFNTINYTKSLTTDTTTVTLTNSATETTINSYAVPANTLSTNKILRIVCSGTYVNTGGNRTLTFYLYYGGTAAANLMTTGTSGTIAAGAGTGTYTAVFYLAANGATNLQSGRFEANVRGGTGIPIIFGASGLQRAIDSTQEQTLYIRAKHSVASTTTTLVSEIMTVELLNATDTIGVPTTRAIATTLPLTGGGDLSADRTLGLGGLTGYGTAGQVPEMNSSATGLQWGGLGSTSVTSNPAGAYHLTNTPSLLDFNASDPILTIDNAGTYIIFARARIDNVGATFSANRKVTLKLRRTNNTAADIDNSTANFQTGIITTTSDTAALVELPPVFYTTTNTNDIIQLWGSIDVVPNAGNIDAVEASIVAYRVY